MASRKSKKAKGKNPKAYPFQVKPQSARTGSKSAAESKAASRASSQRDRREETMAREAPSNYIPPEVSQRMVRRVAILAGIPSVLGVSAFFINYYLLVQKIVELPTWVTAAETLALFGLGFVGISYGVLSASWEPSTAGSWLGFAEFRFNLSVLIQQWKDRDGLNKSSTNP